MAHERARRPNMGACCGTAKVEPLNPAESLPSDWSPLVAHAFFTHEGGAGGLGKENQDVVFVATPSAEIGIFGVLDGHGKEHGRLAAQVGAAVLRSHLTAEHLRLAEDSESVLAEAFASAHAAIRVIWALRKPPSAKARTPASYAAMKEGCGAPAATARPSAS